MNKYLSNMKKWLCCVLALLLVFVLGSALAGGQTTTVLVYMCGTDLQDAGCDDLIEMVEAENGDDVSIVVLAGGAKEWSLDLLQGNTRNLLDFQADDTEDWGAAPWAAPKA